MLIEHMKGRITVLSLLMVMVVMCCLSACNTMEGAGEDIEEAGEAIQDAADD